MELRRIAPGAYDDGEGGLHLDMSEMLRAAGVDDTPENRDALAKQAARVFADTGAEIVVDPQ